MALVVYITCLHKNFPPFFCTGVHALGFVGMFYSTNLYLLFYPSSTYVRVLSHFYCLFPSYLPSNWSGLRWLNSCVNLAQVIQWLRSALSKGPNEVGVLPLTWGQKKIQFSKRRVFYFQEYRTTEKVKKKKDSNSGAIIQPLHFDHYIRYIF
jgi:hypothetical protein